MNKEFDIHLSALKKPQAVLICFAISNILQVCSKKLNKKNAVRVAAFFAF